MRSITLSNPFQVSLLPVRLNIDQYTMDFLQDFCTALIADLRMPAGGEEISFDLKNVQASSDFISFFIEFISVANIASQERPVVEVPQQPKQTPQKMYPELSADSPLNMMPLTPSPVAPSPLGRDFHQKVNSRILCVYHS